MAAALFESLINYHPLVDSNKRVAFFATDVFLRLNGWKLQVDGPDAYRFLMGLFTTGDCNREHLEPWIRASIARLP